MGPQQKPPPPAWIPDWRKIEAYPNPEITLRKQWAWQFLRRNEQYQTEWQKAHAEAVKNCGNTGKFAEENVKLHMTSFGGKWGMHCPAPDPSEDNPQILGFDTEVIVGAITYEFVQSYGFPPWTPSDPSSVGIVFNLKEDISPQLKDAKSLLEAEQTKLIDQVSGDKPTIKHRFPVGEKLREYLRCFDGRAGGVTLDELADVLHPELSNEYPDHNGRQRIRDNLKAAEKIVECTYLHLPGVFEGK